MIGITELDYNYLFINVYISLMLRLELILIRLYTAKLLNL